MSADRLQQVLTAKRAHVRERQAALALSDVESRAREADKPRGFIAALQAYRKTGRYAVIAEIKKASPSKGLIRPEFDPPALAQAYQDGGAVCLSVLTDTPFFQGRDEHLAAARDAVILPVLRKDFMIDPYQIAESRMLGADCVLLIMAALSDAQAKEMLGLATVWGMDALLEVHDEKELDRALRLKPAMIGINNRNLKTLQIDLGTSVALVARIPKDILAVGESGLSNPADLGLLYDAGLGTFLIGESLLRHADVGQALKRLVIDRQ